MKEEMIQLIENHILRDLLWYENKKIPWTDQLCNLSKKTKVELTTGQIETLVKTLSQLSQDDSESIRGKAVSALANFAMKSDEFVAKCADMDVLELLRNSFLDYNRESRAGVLSLVASFCRRSRSEEAVYVVTKLRLLHFVTWCLTSLDEYLVVAAANTIYEMVVHVKLALDLAKMGLFHELALVMMDDLPGQRERTRAALGVVRRASEHSQPVPHVVAKSGCLGLAAHFVSHPAVEYQKLALATVMNVGLVSLNYVTPLFGPHLFCDIIATLMRENIEMKFYAARLISKISENSRMQTLLMLENGLLEALLFNLQTSIYQADPSLIALDNVLSRSVEVTERFIDLKGHLILSILLHRYCSEFVIFSIIKIFTDIFNRGDPYSLQIANLDIYPRLVELYRRPTSSKYLRAAVSDSCKCFLQETTDWELIKNFFMIAPQKQLLYVIEHFSQILPTSLEERKAFLDMDGLQKVLKFDFCPGDPMDQYVEIIKACFPPDVVNYYMPGFQHTICSQIDNFSGLNSKCMNYMSQSKRRDKRGSDAEDDEST